MLAEDFVNITENPKAFQEALLTSHSNEWKKAMNNEITSLKKIRLRN